MQKYEQDISLTYLSQIWSGKCYVKHVIFETDRDRTSLACV